MAHSIKGMAASLGYDWITELAHKLEDRMQLVRGAGALDVRDELSVLFRGLAALEAMRSEEHTSELQSLMRTSYAVFCLKKKKTKTNTQKKNEKCKQTIQ